MEPIPPSPKVSAVPSAFSSLSKRLLQIRRYISESIQYFIRNISCVKTSHKTPPTQAAFASGISGTMYTRANADVRQVNSVVHSPATIIEVPKTIEGQEPSLVAPIPDAEISISYLDRRPFLITDL